MFARMDTSLSPEQLLLQSYEQSLREVEAELRLFKQNPDEQRRRMSKKLRARRRHLEREIKRMRGKDLRDWSQLSERECNELNEDAWAVACDALRTVAKRSDDWEDVQTIRATAANQLTEARKGALGREGIVLDQAAQFCWDVEEERFLLISWPKEDWA